MLCFDTVINPFFTTCWLIAAILIAFAVYGSQRKLISTDYIFYLILFRILAVISLSIVLLQPYLRTSSPDPESYKTIFLADCSGSMRSKDCANSKTRFEMLGDILNKSAGNFFSFKNAEKNNSETYIFSEKRSRHFNEKISILSGRTALGDVLDETLKEDGGGRLGAVVLISDGNSNTGTPVMDIVKKYKTEGIPISCVGIGEVNAAGDVSIKGPSKIIKTRKGTETEIPFTLKNTFKKSVEITVNLMNQDELVSSRKIRLQAGAELGEYFKILPLKTGVETYRLSIMPPHEDSQPETDIDYAAVETSGPDIFKVLYLGANLNWNFKFLKLYSSDNEQVKFEAVVKNGENNFYMTPETAEKLKGKKDFPENGEFINSFDVLFVDAESIPLMSEKSRNLLFNFVADRGGGAIFTGAVSLFDEKLKSLLPVRDAFMNKTTARMPLELTARFIFPDTKSDIMKDGNGMYLPENQRYYASESLKKGAQSAVSFHDSTLSILNIQQFGGGRIAWLATDSLWRWYLESDIDREKYRTFWGCLIVWLGAGAKERMSADFNGKKFEVGDEVPLPVNVFGNDFLPSSDANLTAFITAPDGKVSEMPLCVSTGESGEYSGGYVPLTAGEYRVSVKTTFPGGEILNRSFYFLAGFMGSENTDTVYREDILRDISRITGGRFVHYSDSDRNFKDMPLSQSVNMKTERYYLTKSWLLPFLIFSFLGLEWFMRRRIGLK